MFQNIWDLVNYWRVLKSANETSAGKRPIRQRAGTYGGYTAAESTKIKRTLKGERENGPGGEAKETNEEAKDKIDRLLTEKRKFSRQNRWGNCSYKDLIIHAISSRFEKPFLEDFQTI